MYPKIHSNAIFVADAHYNPCGRLDLIPFLQQVLDERPPQLFLLGDISDLLIGAFSYTIEQNKRLIDLINAIAKSGVEVWYFEGNHDFMLDGVFESGVNVVAKSEQPKIFIYNDQKVALLHGDYSVELRYEIYAKVIRSKAGLMVVNLLSLNFLGNWLLKKIQKDLMHKKLDFVIENFFEKRKSVVEQFGANADVVIEGHFHQDVCDNFEYVYYQNLPAFAREKSFARVQSSQKNLHLKIGKSEGRFE